MNAKQGSAFNHPTSSRADKAHYQALWGEMVPARRTGVRCPQTIAFISIVLRKELLIAEGEPCFLSESWRVAPR